ncbi:MAG TPA: NAD(P)H-dependent oxidoreductase [Dehalococcoidia bacterium]|nr:NAD(P)H-dependent oxidoreductase [Dehalococcoidia bacterium]
MSARVLLLFDSRGGLTEVLAEAIADGVRAVEGAELAYRRIDDAHQRELSQCDALIVGSPNWSGITGKLKEWFDYSGDLWESGELAGKPAGAFTAGWSRSGGIEATLLQLVHLLLAHGMVFVGLPWSERMRQSGSYYGATAHGNVTDDDRAQARALGERVARFAVALKQAGAPR